MFKPILDRVLVRRVQDEKPDSIIEVPEMYRQQSRKGEIVALGDSVVLGGVRVPLSDFLSVGDHVKFGEYNAEPLDDSPDSMLIVRIQDIRGVYDE